MKIISNSDGIQEKEFNLQEIYDLLTNEYFVISEEVRTKTALQYIIMWMPFVTSISVERNLCNDWLDITFTNGKVIRLYDTGLEYPFDLLTD